MKKFITPEIQIRDLTPDGSVMDDITVSGNEVYFGVEEVVIDSTTDAEW